MSAQYPKLILPKGYLSWSQLSCWVSNRSRYVREYFEDGRKLDTRYLRFGGQFSKMVEELCAMMPKFPTREAAVTALAVAYPMDENMRSVMLELDVEGVSEYQIGNTGRQGDVTPACKVRGEVPIVAFLDKYVPRTGGIQEYKTGLAPWTMPKVQKHDQLAFYGVALKACGRPLPPYADLHWVQTAEKDGEPVDFWRGGQKVIMATGRIRSFHREFDPREFERMEDLILRVAREISDGYQQYLSDL